MPSHTTGRSRERTPPLARGSGRPGGSTALTDTIDVEAQEARAAFVLKRAADLETAGDVPLALTYFRQVIKVYPRTPSARTAAVRIKALSGEDPGSARPR